MRKQLIAFAIIVISVATVWQVMPAMNGDPASEGSYGKYLISMGAFVLVIFFLCVADMKGRKAEKDNEKDATDSTGRQQP